jgi:hypothetical protein
MSYQWRDLLNSDLPPKKLIAVLRSVLHSEAEMDKIEELNKLELQSVVDVLGVVSKLSRSVPPVFPLLTMHQKVLDDRGCDGRAPAEMLQVAV